MTKWQEAAWAFLDRINAGPGVRGECKPYIDAGDELGFYRLLVGCYHHD